MGLKKHVGNSRVSAGGWNAGFHSTFFCGSAVFNLVHIQTQPLNVYIYLPQLKQSLSELLDKRIHRKGWSQS